MFVAIARGVIEHLAAHPEALEVQFTAVAGNHSIADCAAHVDVKATRRHERADLPRRPVPPRRRRAHRRRTDEDDHIRDMIMQVLFTDPGERVNRPDFGCGLKALVFAPAERAAAAATQMLVKGSLQHWLQDEIEVAGRRGRGRRERGCRSPSPTGAASTASAASSVRERADDDERSRSRAPVCERRAERRRAVCSRPPRPERDRLRRGRPRRPPDPARHLPPAAAAPAPTASPADPRRHHDRGRHADRRDPPGRRERRRRRRRCGSTSTAAATSRPTRSRSTGAPTSIRCRRSTVFSFMARCPIDVDCRPSPCPPEELDRAAARLPGQGLRELPAAAARPAAAAQPRLDRAQPVRPRDGAPRAARLRRRPALLLPGRGRERGVPRDAAAPHLGAPSRPPDRLPDARRAQRVGARVHRRTVHARPGASPRADAARREILRRCAGRPSAGRR